MSKYTEWSLKKLLKVRAGVLDELSRRNCPLHKLAWTVEIVDDWVPFVVRAGTKWRYGVGVFFTVLPRGRSFNDDLILDPSAFRAAVALCHWLSGVCNDDLRSAKELRTNTFASHLVWAQEQPYPIEDEGDARALLIADMKIGIEGRKDLPLAVAERWFRRAQPPSDFELTQTEAEARTLL